VNKERGRRKGTVLRDTPLERFDKGRWFHPTQGSRRGVSAKGKGSVVMRTKRLALERMVLTKERRLLNSGGVKVGWPALTNREEEGSRGGKRNVGGKRGVVGEWRGGVGRRMAGLRGTAMDHWGKAN